MITINGHTFKPHAVTYLSPVDKIIIRPGNHVQYEVHFVVSGFGARLRFDTLDAANNARQQIMIKMEIYAGGELA